MKKNRGIIIKILLFSVSIILIITTVFLISLLISSKNIIKQFYDNNGNILDKSIAEKISVDINDSKNGMIIRGKNTDNPVLLFISGGPGVPQYWLNEYYPNKLEDYFTVCWWDYYGEGLSYNSKITSDEITLDRLEKDAVEVTEYLKSRFSKNKIYIMAHSGGTPLGIVLAKNHPDLYHCYFAMGQVVKNDNDRYTYGYNFMSKIFKETKNEKAQKYMDSLVTISKDGDAIPKNPDTIASKWENVLLSAGCATTREMTSDATGIFFPQMYSSCYTLKEKINYWLGKSICSDSPYHKFSINSNEKIDFKIPIYFFNGYYDYTCPTPMVETFYNSISSPNKDIYIFENSAHSPLWEENDKVIKIMLEKIISNE